MTRVDDDHRRRLLVARHHLGAAGRPGRTIGDVAHSLALLHSTDPSTPYLSIQARTDAEITDIDAAFYDQRTLLRHTTLRRTVFAMPLDVVPYAHGAYNAALVPKLRSQLLGWIAASPDTDDDPEAFLAATEQAVLDALGSTGPASGRQLASLVPALQVRFDAPAAAASTTSMRITSKVLEVLAADGRIARGRPTGASFTSGAWTWELIDDWLGADGIEPIEPEVAIDQLLHRKLATSAPATVTDLAWWSGLAKGRVRSALARLEAREVSLDHIDEPGYVPAADDLEATPTGDSFALLPGLDSSTMGWKGRAWYVDDRSASGIFDRNGNAGPTVWLDGRVIGAWTQRGDGTIVTDVVDVGLQRALEPEVGRLTRWLGDARVKWRYPTDRTRTLGAV